jgi:ABC-2 type transport system ATP-binding protein
VTYEPLATGTPVIEVEDLSKRFRRYRNRPTSLKERFLRIRATVEEFYAVRDVTVSVPQGATMGLIGPNGSGKTTLLKMIAGILRPTEGRVTARGRIAALLALGAGFHPELTGRENVYLNGSILGMSRQQIDRALEEIVAFAELEEFIDTQVKFYSSGMYVRLGFSVAVHVDPAILLVDEVLAVGDEAFQRKCMEKVREFQAEGRTIILVTHNMDQVIAVCDRAVMLLHGKIHAQGKPAEVVREYRLQHMRHDLAYMYDEGSHEIEIVNAAIFGTNGSMPDAFAPGDELTIQMDLKANTPIDEPVVAIAIHDEQNDKAFGTNTVWRGVHFGRFDGKQRVQFVLKSLPFLEGKFYVTLAVHSADYTRVYHTREQQLSFVVVLGEENPGAYWIPVECRVERL